jgi:predicted flap endonuclease-1-like 5' DNA nuclease
MTAFVLQTSLLMLVAYFLGAALACLIRRSLDFTVRQEAVERRVDPLPEYAHRAAPLAAPRVVPPSAPIEPPPRRQAAPAPVAAQDFKRIRLIDADTEAALVGLGVMKYEQIAAWTRADVTRISSALKLGRRIAQENWIEQAQVLAKGGETVYAARRARGEAATAAPGPIVVRTPAVTPPSELPRPVSSRGVAAAVMPPESAPLVSERAAFAAGGTPAPLPSPAVALRPTPPPESDNLLRIGGIAKDIAAKLNAHGILRYEQIAQWSAADVTDLEGQLDMRGRIARENWIEQAQILSRGGDTRFSRDFDGRQQGFLPTKLADAIRGKKGTDTEAPTSPSPSRQDLGNLRSVRSQAYRDMPEPGPEAARSAAGRRIAVSASNDLKRIRGIGVLIEKRLNSLGVTGYEHIANWTAADIDRISQSLDFKGRIERENWVEQARILSAGGHTEFSSRVDRGEVETSKSRS